MTCIHSFPPISSPDATRLVLGTMPGRRSLEAQQYYAHPRNSFWRIMEQVLAFPAGLDYHARCAALTSRRVAVWDVLKTCTRSGSLDSAIEADTLVPNDFADFLRRHPRIATICFNGAAAEQIWRRHILPLLPPAAEKLPTLRLPSTSPAHAGMTVDTKILQWRMLFEAAPR